MEEKKVIYKNPFNRPIRIHTCCPVGICTCILVKIELEKIFGELGIPVEISPTTEGNPMGDSNTVPDCIITEGMQLDSILTKIHPKVSFRIKDLGKREEIKQDIIDNFAEVGWIEIMT